MSLYRRAAKRDQTEAEIVAHLRAFGFSVERLSIKGAGDVLCGKAGVTRVIEIKTGSAPLRATQREWWGRWKGNGVIVLRTPEQVPTLAKYWTLLDRNLTELLSKEQADAR